MPSRLISQSEAIPESGLVQGVKKPHVTISVKLERTQGIKEKEMLMEDGSKGKELSTSTSLRKPETALTEEQKILELTRRQMMQARKPSE